MSYRIGNKYFDIPEVNVNEPINDALWQKLRKMGIAFETVWYALNTDAYAIKDNPHMWNNRYKAFRWWNSDKGNPSTYSDTKHNNVAVVDSIKNAQKSGLKKASFKTMIDDIQSDFKYDTAFSVNSHHGDFANVVISDTLKADWIKNYRNNLIKLINYFNNNYWGWFDSNGWCTRSCQVSCQQSCQLACQSCQHNTCHNQHCGV